MNGFGKRYIDSLSIDAIGEAGENLVRIACIVSDKCHIAARGGIGAVMGSKNLKAVVVHGDNKLENWLIRNCLMS